MYMNFSEDISSCDISVHSLASVTKLLGMEICKHMYTKWYPNLIYKSDGKFVSNSSLTDDNDNNRKFS